MGERAELEKPEGAGSESGARGESRWLISLGQRVARTVIEGLSLEARRVQIEVNIRLDGASLLVAIVVRTVAHAPAVG